jgi:glycogen debranching enzyme
MSQTQASEPAREWLETDGLGGFSSGTVSGGRTRRYHGVLLVSTQPPTHRVMLVNGLEMTLRSESEAWALNTEHYVPGVSHPDGEARLVEFHHEPWPMWTWEVPGTWRLTWQLLRAHGTPEVWLHWHLSHATTPLWLEVRPLLSGRDLHGLHRENAAFDFTSQAEPSGTSWQPYASFPRIYAHSTAPFAHDPRWYRQFLYTEEAARGQDCVEDLAAPGAFTWALPGCDAEASLALSTSPVLTGWCERRAAELTRRTGLDPLDRAGQDFIVRRGSGLSLIAGYPWFGDWGRDTFIALRGICLATQRFDQARTILLSWAATRSEGQLPNRFCEAEEAPEFNAADASLWFVIAVHELEVAEPRHPGHAMLWRAVEDIVTQYHRGTRYGIRCDTDGLLMAGEPETQLTWMDAKVGSWTVTPRWGKPVELQALWYNAQSILARHQGIASPWYGAAELTQRSFLKRFWCPQLGHLADVVDVAGVRGQDDASSRPNQIFACGGVPFVLLQGERARAVVQHVETHLLTPLGLRTLAPNEPAYVPRYEGDVWHRDGAYHQGTAWPWLLGSFVHAWLTVRGHSPLAYAEARTRFLAPLLTHLHEAGLGHVSEIADAAPPHIPRGCPFQAWSIGELLRMRQWLGMGISSGLCR